MKYRVTRTADVPDELRKMGYRTRITIECDSAWLPDVGKGADEPPEGRAFFNGFEIILKEGDEIEQVVED